MSELKPCPFCGGEADVLELNDVDPDDVNFGGSCICCRQCGANSPVHFDRKENLYASWNDRMELRCSADSDVVPRSEMLEALANQRRRMGAEYDTLYAKLKRVREVARAEIERLNAAPQTAPSDIERAFQDACDEAGCAYDNEALLEAIHALKERCQAVSAPKYPIDREGGWNAARSIDDAPSCGQENDYRRAVSRPERL